MSELPVMLHGEMIDALIVGGGAVANRKARALLNAGATVRIIAPEMNDAVAQLAQQHPRLTLIARAFEPGDVGDAQLVIAATSNREVNRQVAAEGHAAHRLVNVADDPSSGNCRTTATHRVGDLVIGVSAGGVPMAAARVRDRIAEQFGGKYGDAVRSLADLRRALIDDGRSDAWQRAAAAMLDERFCARVESGKLDAEAEQWR